MTKYLAKYIAKSFHLRQLYRQHGMKENHKVYRFFKNLYDYDEYTVEIINDKRYNTATKQLIPNHQQIFRKSDNTYFYRTNERLIGTAEKPHLEKKHYRLGTRSLNPLPILKLVHKSQRKESYLFKKPKEKRTLDYDFQQFLITHLLLLCKKAEFVHVPLEAEQVFKDAGKCSDNVYQHFQTKQVLNFTFKPEQAQAVRYFFSNLDTYADQYDMEESQSFLDPRFSDPTESRNSYLNNW